MLISAKDAAFQLNVSPQLLNYWRKKARVTVKKDPNGGRAVWYTEDDFARVKAVMTAPRHLMKHLPPEFRQPVPQELWDIDPDANIHYQRCTKCWKWVHVNDLARRASYCKACHRIQIDAWNAANPEKVKEYRKVYRKRHPHKIREINIRSAEKRRERLRQEKLQGGSE